MCCGRYKNLEFRSLWVEQGRQGSNLVVEAARDELKRARLHEESQNSDVA